MNNYVYLCKKETEINEGEIKTDNTIKINK
jgi:hypothetical protein